ncbi:MAG: hypothetical protein QOD68_3424 [Actinomycetota bacterium]|jgi:hypothetical protein|nr:hypothetical protein [Actinomycetota bacterium]
MRVDSGGVTTAAGHLAHRAGEVTDQVNRCAALPAGLSDRVLHDGVAVLADVAADAFELVGRDLALLATKVRAGALLYDRVETGLAESGLAAAAELR